MIQQLGGVLFSFQLHTVREAGKVIFPSLSFSLSPCFCDAIVIAFLRRFLLEEWKLVNDIEDNCIVLLSFHMVG